MWTLQGLSLNQQRGQFLKAKLSLDDAHKWYKTLSGFDACVISHCPF